MPTLLEFNKSIYARLTESKVLRVGLIAVCFCAVILLILKVHKSAETLIAQSTPNEAYNDSLNSAPLATLTGVVINARQDGHDIARLNAEDLTIGRNMSAITVDHASGVVPVFGTSGSKIAFTCGQAQYLPGIFGLHGGSFTLSQGIAADFSSGIGPVHISAQGMSWQAMTSIAKIDGAVTATVGKLGQAVCQSMLIDVGKKMIDFGPVEIVAASPILQTGVAQAASEPKPAADSETVHVHITQDGHWDENHNVLHVNGPVTITQGDVRLMTVGVDYDNTAKIAHALSPVTIIDDSNSLKGDKGDVNFKTHVATITGHVDIYAIPKASATKSTSDSMDTETRQPTHVHCDNIEYNYRTKLADASGHLTVLQTTRTVTADTGHYDTSAQIINLVGHIDGKSTDGKHLTAPEATVSVNPDDEWIEVKGPVSYEFPVDQSDNPLPNAAQKKSGKATKTQPIPSTTPAPALSP